jgi:hypothetical protein
MQVSYRLGVLSLGAVFAAGLLAGVALDGEVEARAASDGIYELRTYTAAPGKVAEVIDELRHAAEGFERHGITNVGYWVPTDPPHSETTVIYMLKFDTREGRAQQFEDFRTDPEWRRVFEEYNKDGRIVANVDALLLNATDYSPLQ